MAEVVSDEALLARAARGDELAFRWIYARHRDAVYRFVRRLGCAGEAAEDVTQDCFLSLMQDPSRFDARRASLRTYLCGAARNRAISRLRREGRETSLEEGTLPIRQAASDAEWAAIQGTLSLWQRAEVL